MHSKLLLSTVLFLTVCAFAAAEEENIVLSSPQIEEELATTQEPVQEPLQEPVQEPVQEPIQEPVIEPVLPPVQPEVPVKVVELVHPDYLLKHIVNQGTVLFLNDYSGWSIRSKDREIAAQWQKGDTIRLFYEQKNWFQYKVDLCNLTRHETVSGSLKEIPNLKSPDTLIIQSVENDSLIHLNNGAIFQALWISDVKSNHWQVGDLVSFLYWGELDGKASCALWNHDRGSIIGEMMLLSLPSQ